MNKDVLIRLHQLEHRITVMITYLRLRMDMADWHGVMDAAADLRELETERRVLLGLEKEK